MRLPHVGLTAVGLLAVLAACGGSDGPTGSQNGSIQGSVTAEGSGVSGVAIALSGGGSRTTDASGGYRFDDVSPGSHTLTMTLPEGYELDAGNELAKQVTVSAGQTATVSWSLREEGLPTAVEVVMQATSFNPSAVELAVGGTVTWRNAQAIPHTITPESSSQAGVWANHTVPAEQGYTFAHTFDSGGTFEYHCQVHAGMTGTIEVR